MKSRLWCYSGTETVFVVDFLSLETPLSVFFKKISALLEIFFLWFLKLAGISGRLMPKALKIKLKKKRKILSANIFQHIFLFFFLAFIVTSRWNGSFSAEECRKNWRVWPNRPRCFN